MCGRFTIDVDLAEIIKVFKLDNIPAYYRPQENIAPSQKVPVVLQKDSKRNLNDFRWGLIPSWTKEQSNSAKLFNARAETVAAKPSFRRPFLYQRCLVPATGFYEWQTIGKQKIPYLFSATGKKLIAFAGIWDSWLSPTAEEIFSFSIITTVANDQMQPYHDRMPVILAQPEEQEKWLLNQPTASLLSLLKPYEGQLDITQVAKL